MDSLLDYCRLKFMAAGIKFNHVIAQQPWPRGYYKIGLLIENTTAFIVKDTLEIPDIMYNPRSVFLFIGNGKFGTTEITFYYK